MPSSETPTPEDESPTPATAWKPELPRANRPRPRAFGVGRFGIDNFDRRDDTRYLWTRVLPAITSAFLAVFLGVAPAKAANSYCEAADAATTLYQFCKPSVDVEGANRWGDKYNENVDMMESALGSVAASTAPLAVSVAALSASTIAIQAQLNLFVSTSGPLVSTLGQSTGTLRSDFSAFVSTAGPLVSTLGQSTAALSAQLVTVGIDTATLRSQVALATATLSASTVSLNALKLSSPTVSGTVGQFVSLGSNGLPAWASAGTGDVTQAGGGAFGNAAVVSFAHEDVITSSHPCRVIQSTSTSMSTDTGTNTTLAGDNTVPGSSVTLVGVNSTSFPRFCAMLPLSKNNAGSMGCAPMIDGVIMAPATVTRMLWHSNVVEAGGSGTLLSGCWTGTTAMSAGTHIGALGCLADANTWTLNGSSPYNIRFTFQEVTCKD